MSLKKTKSSEIFQIAQSADNVICPPEQVFRNQDFDFLLTLGGHLVEDAEQYNRLMKLLNEIGESNFTIKENIGATFTDRKKALKALFPVNSNLIDFNNKINHFDEYFGISTLHWFVFGEIQKWGIYISEYPSINIIGCNSDLTEKFRRVFDIEGNGYEQVKKLLHKEFEILGNSDERETFLKKYKIKP